MTISSKGQVTIPASVRRQLNAQPGDRLYIEVKQGKAIINKDSYQEQLSALRAQARRHLVSHGLENLSIEEINRRAEQAKQAEYK